MKTVTYALRRNLEADLPVATRDHMALARYLGSLTSPVPCLSDEVNWHAGEFPFASPLIPVLTRGANAAIAEIIGIYRDMVQDNGEFDG